jgi:hypothetical protein
VKLAGSPSERRLGRLRVDVGVGPIARMFPAPAWREPANATGGAVFAGRAGEVIENVAAEPQPDRAPAGLFNLDAHIHDADSGHPVPYLTVRATVRRNDGAVLDVPLVPVARPHKGVSGLHYGNNVALEPSGRYRVAVTVEPGPLTGTETALTLDFDLDFDPAATTG